MGTDVDSEHERAQWLYNALVVELGPPADPLRIAQAKAHRVLDIGCGDGCWVIEQADLYRSKEFFGVDMDPRAVHRAANAAIVAGRRNAIFWQQSTYQELDPAMCESESFGFFMQEIQPFLFGAKVINASAYAALLSQAEQEMADLRFCGIVFGVTCSGTKP